MKLTTSATLTRRLSTSTNYDMEGKLLGDKAVSVVFDYSKLKSLVPGFHAQVTFADGVRRTIDHIMKHPELQVEDPEFEAWCDRVVEALGVAKREVVAAK